MSGHWLQHRQPDAPKPPGVVNQILGWLGLDSQVIGVIVFIVLIILVLVFLD